MKNNRLLSRLYKAGMITSLLIIIALTNVQGQPKENTKTTDPSARIQPSKKGYAPVNGLQLYYEIYGQGKPLVLIHGGLGATEMFNPIMKPLAEKRQVIAVDLQAHGRTADIDRPMSYEAMADDIAGLLKHLGVGKADMMGYSLGGGVAQQVVIRHPQIVRKVVVLSAPYKRTAWYPELLAGQAQMGTQAAEQLKPTPIYQLYAAIAPRKEDWPVLCTKLGALLTQDYDWSKEVAAITAPVLIIAGDADGIIPTHLVAFFGLLGGGKRDAGWDGAGRPKSSLAIISGATHYDVLTAPVLVPTVTTFLDAAVPEGK